MFRENFLDLDTAYLLGLIAIRGRLSEAGGDHRVVISFPSKNLVATGIKLRFDQKKHLRLSVNQIRDRLVELLGSDVDVRETGKDILFVVRFLRNTMAWRNLKVHFGEKKSYTEFEVPASIIAAPQEFQTEFMRGVADAGGFIRDSNNYMGGKRRVYIEVNNKNWQLPVQICGLLQRHLGIPVQTIQWGHPNVRTPTVSRGESWAKEHQIKIFAESFLKVGFYVEYKQKILQEFAEADSELGGHLSPPCNPNPAIRRITEKPTHPGESSPRLPPEMRGKHFDTYWQLCLNQGCDQKVDAPQRVLFEIDEQGDSDRPRK